MREEPLLHAVEAVPLSPCWSSPSFVPPPIQTDLQDGLQTFLDFLVFSLIKLRAHPSEGAGEFHLSNLGPGPGAEPAGTERELLLELQINLARFYT